MVYKMVLNADILNGHLADKLNIDTDTLPPPDQDIHYELSVDFSHKRIHDEAQIMAFPVEDKPFIKNSAYRDRIGYALSEQLKNIESRFLALGYDVDQCSINGEAFEEKEKIIIRLFEGKAKEFDKKGNPKGMKVYSIAPSVPGLNEIIAKTVAEMIRKEKKEKFLEEKKREEHIPNNVDVNTLFELIACGIFMDQRLTKKSRETRIHEAASNLLACFDVQKGWPLQMSGHIGENSKEKCAYLQVDCSEWMVFIQDNEGKWSLSAVDSAEEARKAIERDIVKQATHEIVVLHNLIPAFFSLMAQGQLGLSLIGKKDAPQHKRVQVVWGNSAC